MTEETYTRTRRSLERSLERERRELVVALGDLGGAARSALDPVALVARHPAGCLAAAFALGLWLGRR